MEDFLKSEKQVSLAAGVIIIQEGDILLVKENNHWSLPKGGQEAGEFLIDTAIREAFEETGFKIKIENLAFVTEFILRGEGHYLQLFYEGTVVGGQIGSQDPDVEIQDVRFVPISELRSYLTFKPRLLPLEEWLKGKQIKYFSYIFDLDELEA